MHFRHVVAIICVFDRKSCCVRMDRDGSSTWKPFFFLLTELFDRLHGLWKHYMLLQRTNNCCRAAVKLWTRVLHCLHSCFNKNILRWMLDVEFFTAGWQNLHNCKVDGLIKRAACYYHKMTIIYLTIWHWGLSANYISLPSWGKRAIWWDTDCSVQLLIPYVLYCFTVESVNCRRLYLND